METYLYFAEGGGADATTEAVMYPASRFIGVGPKDADETYIYFESAVGDYDESAMVGDIITVDHADKHAEAGNYHTCKRIAENIVEAINRGPHADGKMTTIIDRDNGIYFGTIADISSEIAALTVPLDS